MLNDATGFTRVYVVCGFTDLRKDIERLAVIIQQNLFNKAEFLTESLCILEPEMD